MKKAAFLLVCGVLMTGLLYAQEVPVEKVTGGDDLVEQKGPWEGTWVHPDADISKYGKLYLWDSVFQFREGGATSAGTTMQMMRGDSSGPYAVNEESRKKFKEVVDEAVVKELKRRGYILAIVSDSYTLATEWLKMRLAFDYTIANELSLKNGKISGEVKMPLGWGKGEEQCLKHSVCKLTALIQLSQKTGIPLGKCVAIGDNLSDVCMLEKAGLGIAFNPKHAKLETVADIVITKDLSCILSII